MPTNATAKQPKWGGRVDKVARAKNSRKDYERRVAVMMRLNPGASPGEIDEMIYRDRE